jgi:hypothetical protein
MTDPPPDDDVHPGSADSSAAVEASANGESTTPVAEGAAPSVEVAAWSITDLLPTDWTPYVADLARWKQGDLVLDLPVAWLTPGGTDLVTGADNPHDDVRPVAYPAARIPAVICSQTCDVGATPPGDRQPFVELAPLVPHSALGDRSVAKLALQGRIGYLVKTRPPFEGGPEAPETERAWFADLRMMFPASKGVLLGRQPVGGFDDENQRLLFAESVAVRFRRPALDPTLSERLPAALAKFVTDNKTSPAMTAVEQVRLLIVGDRLSPTRVQLLVLASDMPLPFEAQQVWLRFQAIAANLLKAAGLAVGPMTFTDPRHCSAERYRASVPVPCDRLGPDRWW